MTNPQTCFDAWAQRAPGGPEIGDLLARISQLISCGAVSDDEAIQLGELSNFVRRTAKKHANAIWVLSRFKPLPDPGIRLTFEEARKEKTLRAALGFIWQSREYLAHLEAKYRGNGE